MQYAQQRYNALNKELADSFVDMVSRSLPGGAYFGNVRNQISGAAGQGFNAVMAKARQLAQEPNYGTYITRAINQATSSPQITKMVSDFANAAQAMRAGQQQGFDFSGEQGMTPIEIDTRQETGIAGRKQKGLSSIINKIRQMVGLGPGAYDRELYNALKKVEQQTGQQIVGGKGQRASDLVARLTQAIQAPQASPNRELPPMPGQEQAQAPAGKKVDIAADDARKAMLSLNQQLWQDLAGMGVDTNSKTGRDIFRAIQGAGYHAAVQAAKSGIGGDQAAIQKYVQDYLKQYYLTPQFFRRFTAK